jgi:hypothetical protein
MWNTTDIPLGTYTLRAYAVPVLGETHTTDNIETNGVITVVPEFPSFLILPLFMTVTLLAVMHACILKRSQLERTSYSYSLFFNGISGILRWKHG